MVAIGTGTGVGLERSSTSLIGPRGQIGSASTGRAGDSAFVNAANGNLVITRQDEFLVGLGPDAAISRTYNSQATVGDGDNNDQWRMSAYRRIIGTNGAATITRVDWDGSETVFTQTAANTYVSKDGDSSYNEIFWISGTSQWVFRNTKTRVRDTYDSSGKLLTTHDLDSNTLTYAYTGSLLSSITTQSGERTDFVYGGTGGAQLQQITTVSGSTSVRVRYGYDGSNRLQTVTVDLTPEDGSIADGKTYVTTYGYDGTSKRVASIAQSDGSLLQIGYSYSGTDYRVVSLTETVASGVTRVTGLYYDIANRTTRITDPAGGVTTMAYDLKGNLTQIVMPVPSPGAAAPTVDYTYNANGDVTSMTENGRRTDYEYDAMGNQTLSRDAAGNTIIRTYGLRNEVITSTQYLAPDLDGAGAGAATIPVTTRYANDGENHLRFMVTAEGAVTEYRYDRQGRRVSVIAYKDAVYNVSGLAPNVSITEATLNAWVSALTDKSTAQRTDTFYDFRGNVASEVSYASLSVFGEGGSSPLGVTPGANTTVVHQPDGLFRITKTSGVNGAWDADAHSTIKTEGDFVLRLRPVQAGTNLVGGVSTAPGNSASYENPQYGFFFMADGNVCFMENGIYSGIATYVANDNFWLTRVGSTISYYKGATLAAAMAAGPLRTMTGSTGALHFDSSVWNAGASLDVEFTPQAIVNGVNTSVTQQPDGMVRVTKTGGSGWDADARGTTRADGDFVVHLKAVTTDNWVIAGASRNPAAGTLYNTVDFSFYFAAGNQLWAIENDGYALLGSYKAGEDFWLTRVGGTINYYRGPTLETAVAAGPLRTVTGVAGSFYFDSAILVSGGAVDAEFTALPIADAANTVITMRPDGLLRVTKNGSDAWNGDARSTTRAAGDFVLKLRPGQSDKYLMGGVSANPAASTSYETIDYSLYFNPNGVLYYFESGSGQPIAGGYAAGDTFWIVRSGSTISYYKGATLDAAKSAGALRTRTGVTGTFAFDSSLHSAGSILDVSFDATVETSRSNYIYSANGQLLSRVNSGSTDQETFVYDGLGRLVGTTDMANATSTFLFNDANSTTTATLAGGLTRTAVYNKAGELISVTESGANVTTAVTNYFYDGLGRLRMKTDPLGAATYHVYDRASRKVADITTDGSMTEYTHDSSGRLVKTVGYINKLTAAQIALLDDFTAAGAGGAATGAQGISGGPTGNNLLVNGGFDESAAGYTPLANNGRSNLTLPGWTKINSEAYEQVNSGVGGVTATEGNFWLDMDSVAGSGNLIGTGSNFVLNPSFETPAASFTSYTWGRSSTTLPNWTKANAQEFEQVATGNHGVAASDGTYWLDLDSIPSVRTTTGGNLILNPSFETYPVGTASLGYGYSSSTLPNWTKANAEDYELVISGNLGVLSSSGYLWLDMDSVPGPGAYAPVGPNLLVNGSFDMAGNYLQTSTGKANSTLPGWTKTNAEVFEQTQTGTHSITGDGGYWLDMDSVSGGIVPLGDNLIVNGSFETSGTTYTTTATGRLSTGIPGWTRAGTSQTFEQVNSGVNGVASTDGAYYLDMEPGGNADISQTITGLTSGQQLLISFDYSNAGPTVYDGEGNPEPSGSLQVFWNGVQIAWIGNAASTMTTKSFTVTANGTSGTLRFKEVGQTNGVGVGIDNVKVTRTQTAPTTGGNMDFSQTIGNLTAGQVLRLQFDHANRTTAASGSFEVYWNGALIGTYNNTGLTMITETLSVTAIAGNNVLRFKGTGTVDAAGASLDNVRLYATAYVPNGGNMDISQTVSGLTAGQIMRLQFDHANRTTAASGSFNVYWNGTLVAQVTSTGATMVTDTYDVAAIAGNNTLRFLGTGTVDAHGASLDNVRLFATQATPHGGNMDVSQAINGLTAGQTYQLRFDHANRTTAASGSFDVYWNTTLVAQINSAGTTMVGESYFVVAAAGANTLRFVGTGTVDASGASIDNVRLLATQVDVGGGNMDISQTIPNLAAGQAMLLQFDHANRTNAASGSFNVYWNGALVAQVTSTGTTMVTDTLNVTAIAGNNVLRFVGTGTVDAVGASIDNVRLFATQAAPNGGGTATDALAGLRPVAHADDRYGWNIYDAAGRLVETIDGSGAVTTLSYDGASQLVETRAFANLLAAATVTAYKSATPTALTLPAIDAANDRVARNFYRKDGLLAGSLDGEGYLSENVYDGRGLLIETIRYATATAPGDRAAGSFATLRAGVTATVNVKDIHNWYVHDGRGLLRGEINGEGDLTRYHYTAAGDVDQKVRGQKLDPAALIAARPTFASLATAAGGQITETTRYTRDSAGKVMSENRLLADGTSWTTLYGYDSAGRLTSRTEAAATGEARTLTQRFDARGNLIGELGGEGSAALAALGGSPAAAAVDNVYATWGTIYSYDAADRLVAMRQSNGVNGAGNRTVYYYTANGLLAFEVNALGEVTENRYNARGERTDTVVYGTRMPAGTLPGLVGGTVTAAFQSTIAGIANASLDSLGHADYNVTGTVKQSSDGLGNTITYAYNAFGELRTRTDPINASSSVQTDRLYDRRGLLVSEKRDSAAGGLQLETLYGHDAFGRPSQVTDAAGRVRKTDYDRAGRVALTTDARNATQSFGYDGRGNVISITDRNNATTTFTHDAFSRTSTSTTPGQITTTIKRNAHGQTVSIKDGALRETIYAYDKDGNLLSETDAVAQVQHFYDSAGRHKETIDGRGSKTSYTYDAANRVLTEKVNDGGLNLVTAYEYDAKGQNFKITDPANRVTLVEFDRGGRKTAVVVDSAGLALRTEYDYDKSGRLLTVTEAPGTAVARVTQYEYDKADRLLRSQVDPSGLNLLTQYSYDKAGNVARKIDAANFVTTYAYDAENRLTRTLDAEGGVVETFYDNEGRVAGLRRYAIAGSAVAAAGGAFTISVTPDNGRDQVSAYFYDSDGRLRVSVDGAGRPTEFLYDNAGNVVRTIEYAGTIAFAIGESLATIQSRTAGLANLADNRITRAVYDGANRQAYVIDATGQVTAFGYDGGGNVIKRVSYFNLLAVTYDPSFADMAYWTANYANINDRVERTFYDGASRATFSVDAENYVTQKQYDAAGRVTKLIRHAYQGYSTVDGVTEANLAAQIGLPQANAAVTAFTYDSAGRLTDTTDPENSVTHLVLDRLGQATDVIAAYNVPVDSSTTHRVFDKAGRVQSETRAFGTTESSTTSYIYDGMGRMRYATDPYNVTTEYIYDGLGRCIHEVQPLNAGQIAHTYKEYDKFGNLVKLTDPRANAALFHYDALNRLVWQTDPEGYVTKTTYSRGDEVASVTRYATAVSGTTSAAPPAVVANAAADATTSFERDKLDRVKSVTDAESKTEVYTLNAFGDRVSVKNKINGTTINTFDKRGLLRTETLPVGSTRADGSNAAANIVNKYDYDARGNRITVTEAWGIVGEERITNFVYDKADRLKQKIGQAVIALASPTGGAAWTTPTETYNYDARGNLIETVTSWGARTLSYYDDHDRKTAEIQATSATHGTLSKWDYDLNGNVKAARIYADPFALPAGYGATPTSASPYRETLYGYDANNRRTTSKVVGLQSGEYASGWHVADIVLETVYDLAGNVIEEKDGRLNSVFSYYDRAGRKIAQVDQERYLTFYTLDGEGNVKTEERFANQVAWADINSIPVNLRAGVAGGLGDRITHFEYDRNGRRTSETRMGVNGKSLTGSGHLQAAHSPDARIVYEYNGLGQVVRKTEANQEVTEFEYDVFGRQTAVQSGLYTDFQNSSVRRRTETAYNGLGNVTRSVGKSKTGASDRVTTYTYGAGGRLEQMKDAADFVRTYSYDAAGNIVLEAYSRANSAGVGIGEANGYRYDLLNRVTSESVLTWNGGWSEGVVTKVRYNSFGEMTGRGLNGDASGTAYQETFDYDAGGRMWRSTASDGSVRIYGHDKAGNANLVIASAGDDLSALSLAGAIGAYAGGGSGVATTVTVFDKRGQAVTTHELQRQTAAGVGAQLITTGRAYNAFGEVRQESDAFNRVTDYSYNTAGKLTKRELPTAAYTTETGAVVTGTRATENYSYDLSGRLIGIEDAYGNDTTRRLLVGTGYGNDAAIVITEYHPDDGVATKAVDEFGDVRTSTDEILRVTGYTYDKMGRLTELAHAGGLTDSYRYDGLGQRTQHWNSFFGSGVVDRTDYDSQGRVTQFVQASGTVDAVTISTAYTWDPNRSTNGLGTFGGWVKTTTHADRTNNNQSVEATDYFGHMIGKTDLGGRTYAFTYDKGGRVIQQTSSASQNLSFTYFNTGKAATITDSYVNASYSPNSVQATFAYDAAGNRTFEGYTKTSYQYDYWTGYSSPYTQSLQAASVTYDELGRMKSFDDTGATGSNPVSIDWEYDQVGNVRRVLTTYTPVGLASWMSSDPQTSDRWYTYDSMNRMIHVMGYMANGQIGSDMWSAGGFVQYDKAGQRKSVTNNTMDANYSFGKVREEYTYTASGQLDYVTQSTAWYYDIMDPNSLGPYSAPVVIADNTRDGLGRLTAHSEYANGVSVFSQSSVYNYLSQVTSESTFTKMQDGSTTTTSTSYDYRAAGQYQGGVVTSASSSRYNSSTGSTSSQTTNSYVWWDEAKISTTTSTSGTTASSFYSYDENGKLASVNITGNRPRTVNFVTDLNGQVMSRTEYSSAPDNPKDIYFYFNGIRVGDLGNHGPSETDYSTAIAKRGAPPQNHAFDNEYNMPSIHADFDQSFSPIGPNSEGSSHGSYIAREGDTLRTIAQAVWGDADMWYLIGEANGFSADATLVAGQRVRIPAKVTNIHNNADTFRVYDPNRAIGDNSPSQVAQAKPSARRGGCGMLGTIILIAVAVAITLIIKAPVIGMVSGLLQGTALAGAATVIGAAATGAIASVISQGVGVATGIQEKFSWKGVAMSALSAGITQGVGGGTLLQGAGKFANDVARGAVINAATQGVAVATGLQKKFDWAGVAVAGVVSGVSGAIGRALPGQAVEGRAPTANSPGVQASPPSHFNQFASSLGGAIAGAGVRSIVTGTSFGDNVIAVLPDVIGSTIGNIIGRALTAEPRMRTQAEPREEAGTPSSGESTFDLRDPIVFPDLSVLDLDGLLDPYWSFESISARLVQPGTPAQGAVGNAPPAAGSDRFYSLDRSYSLTDNGTLPWDAWAITYGGPSYHYEANEDYFRETRPAVIAQRIIDAVDERMALSGLTGYAAARSSAAHVGIAALRFHDIGQDGYPYHGELGRYLGGAAVQRFELAERLAPPLQVAAGTVAATDDRTWWNRGWSAVADGGDWLINGGLFHFNRGRDAQDRVMGPSPMGYGSDVAVGFISTIARALTGTMRAIGDPRGAGLGVASALDRVFLDDRPASQVVRENWARLRSSSAREIAMGTGEVGGQIFLIAGPAKAAAGRLAFTSRPSAFANLEPLPAINPLRAGVLAEGRILNAIGSDGKVPFTPTAAQIESAAFRLIVGEPKYTAGGAPVSTIYDGSRLQGLVEVKTGRSRLDSSYQLRLQTYGALVNNQQLTILTNRPVGPQFGAWLNRWGVNVEPLPGKGR